MPILSVSITGPESSGKSFLAQDLASAYDAPLATEFARAYLKDRPGNYTLDDLVRICAGQLASEERALRAAETICFFDTDMLVLKVWAQFRFGKVPYEILTAWEQSTYGLILLCKPDLPWTPDPLRESPGIAEREALYGIYKDELRASGKPFAEISGTGASRYSEARRAIESHKSAFGF